MEYSGKYKVSLSTLRRRIKGGEIEFKFTEGKYLLEDGPLQLSSEAIAPPTVVMRASAQQESEDKSMCATTQGLLNEIKKAYTLILQEKEQNIIQLKEEVADLRTLVRVLEDETNRLKKSQASFTEFELDLET